MAKFDPRLPQTP